MFTVSVFINNYLPENNNENNLYKEMLDAFSLRLLGYELNDIYIEQIHNFQKIKKKVTGLSTILEFIIFTIPIYNDKEGSPFVSNIQKISSFKILKGESKKNIFNVRTISKLNNFLDVNNHPFLNENPMSSSNNNSLKMSYYASSVSNSPQNRKVFFFDILNKTNIECKHSQFNKENAKKKQNTELNKPKNYEK